ncbi:DUF4381 domain-containing protein [Salinimonas chungwhensis]|uniref:DUF4381 domain-containing protein n=1 Tax=Salinimonas chungwhensis TaxID=265425 RepID=UPI0003A5D546|nr:DUF4381 domain-containing protein [Salinimonas chungwhensis]
MNEQQQLLSQLNDIHKTSAQAWPAAWGWWLVGLLALAVIVGLFFWWRRQRRFNMPRREAISEMKQIDDKSNDWPSQMNQVLKRAALAYYPRYSLSGLYGQRWTQFMVERVSRSQQPQMAKRLNELQDMLYQPTRPDPTLFNSCQKAALDWLKKARFKHAVSVRETGANNV